MLQTKTRTNSCGTIVEVYLLWTWSNQSLLWKGWQLVLVLFASLVVILIDFVFKKWKLLKYCKNNEKENEIIRYITDDLGKYSHSAVSDEE